MYQSFIFKEKNQSLILNQASNENYNNQQAIIVEKEIKEPIK